MNKKFNFKETAEAVKARINCLDYAHEMGLIEKEETSSYRGFSTIGGNNPTCFMIYKDNPDYYIDWKDANENSQPLITRDVIDLCATLNHNGDKVEALKELVKKTGINTAWEGDNTSEQVLRNQTNLIKKTDYLHQQLLKNQDFLDNLHKRKINDNTIAECKLGYSPLKSQGSPITMYEQDRLFIPYLKDGKPVYYCTRLNHNYTPNGNNKKYLKAKVADYGRQICWGLDTVNRKTPLIVAEGAFDALSFYQEGYAVLSPITGRFSQEQKEEFLTCARRVIRQNRDIILIFDSDEAGESFTKANARFLFDNFIPFKTASIPEGKKDVSEYYEEHEEVNGILNTTQDGLIYLAKSFKGNKREFKEFILKASRYHEDEEIATIFEALKDGNTFDLTFVKNLEKACNKAPREKRICKEIKKDKDLTFCEGSGFYEYEDNIWRLKTDTDIKGYISDAMGKFATGGKTESILKLLSANCNDHIEFNKKPLMSFKNGTLELDTGIFRKPFKEDYITVKASYDYDASASCPLWLNFLYDVTSQDLAKIDLLQEIAGYCLFTENSLQKCAYLIGDGANGKSVFINIIEDVFGSENISHVEMSQFTEQFNRIALKDSMINIATELKTNVRGAESVFNRLTVGETIDGCLKHKNIITFKPRAKLIMSANEFIIVNDPTFAIERRINFVRFNERFVPDPQNSFEHKADTELPEKLKTELPGIFNWLYDGYKKLKKNKRFTETEESKEVLKEFREAIDPVTAFINDNAQYFNQIKEITNKQLYSQYQLWASEGGYKYPVTAATFKRRFKKAFLKVYPDWTDYHNKYERGYRKKEIED